MLRRERSTRGPDPRALDMLQAAATALSASSSPHDAAPSLLEILSASLRAERAAMWRLHPDDMVARCVASWNRAAEAGPDRGVSFAALAAPAAGRSGEGVGDEVPIWGLLGSGGPPPRVLAAQAAGMTGSACVTLRSGGEPVGALEVIRAGPPPDRELSRALDVVAALVIPCFEALDGSVNPAEASPEASRAGLRERV